MREENQKILRRIRQKVLQILHICLVVIITLRLQRDLHLREHFLLNIKKRGAEGFPATHVM